MSLPSPTDSSVDPLIGQTLGGRYTIRRMIGRGGVGLVYLSTDTQEDRQCVVKVLAPNWADNSEALARFEREAQSLNGMEHPNIVKMFDFGHEAGRAYIVMEYVDGELLNSYVSRKGRLELEDFVPIASQILKGLGYAHSRGLMVRDIKPANIMLCAKDGRANFVKLLDFGLAKLIEGDEEITQQHVVGTAGYLSPEQIKGEEIDLRVDVYAVGVLFYYMLSGRLPFEGDSTATLFYKHVNEEPPRLEVRLGPGHGVPASIINLIHDCLHKDRDKRPSDANEIVEGLIDAVPSASMFRLPKLSAAPASPAALTDSVPAGTAVAMASADSAPAPVMQAPGTGEHPSGAMPVGVPGQVPHTGSFNPMPTTGEHAMMVTGAHPPGGNSRTAIIIGALALLLAGGIGAYVLTQGAGGDASAQVDEDAVTAKLDEVAKLIDGKQFDEARKALDAAKAEAAGNAKLEKRAEQLGDRLVVDRLLAQAKTNESAGDIDAAISAYEDILERDATHAEARKSLARLKAKSGQDADDDDGTKGTITMSSEPIADLYIDGKARGTTPFAGKLEVGKHSVKMTLDGYESYEETIEVSSDENLPVDVTLRPKGAKKTSAKYGRRPSKKTAKTSDPAPATAEPKPEPKPEKKPEKKPKKDDPFLPTSKGGKGDGIFLPTGK